MEKTRKGKRKMFISVLPEEQVEVVLSEEGVIVEYYVEMVHQAKTKGNIYKGIINNIDSNLQAAFVNYGAEKNGFLQVDEVHPEYYSAPHDPSKGKKYPLLQKVLKAGQEVLVQVVKEPTGSKGAFLTSYLSLPGRFLVLTPGREQIGVSRKVESEEERVRLRALLEGATPGPGLGLIVRTVSVGQSKTSIQRDLQFLKRLWKDVRKKGTVEKAPSLIYKELDLAARAVRDYLTDDVGEVWVDDEQTADAVQEFAAIVFPRRTNLVKRHKDTDRTLWERFSMQKQLDQIYSREVSLPSGGRLVFDQTEALMAIDINSGKIAGKTNFESMALRTNMEAAETIAQQLKLRDIGGQIVVDFIEMRDRNHWREVEKTLRAAMKNDRARHDVGKMSRFGLLQIVRQRLGSSALSISTEPCPCCKGTGLRRNMEWQAMQALKDIHRQLRATTASSLRWEAPEELGMYLLNHKRGHLTELENRFERDIDIAIRR
ncbi:ribonuclease, Rne/Rng family [Oleidesulfovibrio alaskensis G20]|jgi:ribonuclease E|uniref:Ribonuclease G n=1 Tax=Oleidesulfovibrio alaskensis (strain ATCC BAA-1058 / DSM 17464 / G20) TaxID=207559 RepID=Q315Q8_OLEA2|nr:Rne/Rng family ribonuclease [Oleidesulfovibrio alaskensis]ABB37338.1 ribonuclease, Rne/Rng family [Oleidesulfovibrio alaskensis G20]MBG0773241.1 Rne/Rng family ribonuclease [Oleidesulfovibrio alaskensis]